MADDGAPTNGKTLLEKIEGALNELLTLDVVTAIVPLQVSTDASGHWTLTPQAGAAAEGVVTKIRLEQGDITNAVSTGALANADIMAMHGQQVTLSRQIIADNLKALFDLAKSLEP